MSCDVPHGSLCTIDTQADENCASNHAECQRMMKELLIENINMITAFVSDVNTRSDEIRSQKA